MATKSKKKKPTKRLYNEIHVLIAGGMDSNCYMTVIGEFAGGHEGMKDFDGKRLTNDEWFAVLKESSIGEGLAFFGGTRKTIEELYPFGQEAFRKFLERNGIPVKKVESPAHVGYLAYLTKDLILRANKAKRDDHYRDDPVEEEWRSEW